MSTPPGPEQPNPGGWQPPTGGQWEAPVPQPAGRPAQAQWGSAPPRPPETNGKAITALVLGIGGFLVCPIVLSVAAIIIGGQARNEIRASQGRQTGDGMAKAGVILGWVSLALTVLFIIGIIAFGVLAEESDSGGSGETGSDPVSVITFVSDAAGVLGSLL